ncbi:SMI1/KNR4 family protein [Bacillus swezeyi]|uniref:hypothetical protein n=1 Tax=Bacillus swezeyi TaxID=1925020 RepID=UPI002958CC26|nr:hypothetical protein [Bacillus swezeyi]
MNTKELIIDFINKHATPHDFTGGINKEKITKIKNDLQTILPESYKWFLKKLWLRRLFWHRNIGLWTCVP